MFTSQTLTPLLPLMLVLWLLPCAIQDYRHRRVANVLTVPAFFAAWPLALWLGDGDRLMFTLAVFAGCWFAWQMGGMGAADGKMATLIAAVSPPALGMGGLMLALGFVGMRLWKGKSASLPAGIAFYAGAVEMALFTVTGIGT
ncbi:MAG: prepilin peptidase [Caldilineaceae bacterium]|nr:prepilin peptidase [Caldilineaceae bacterium]